MMHISLPQTVVALSDGDVLRLRVLRLHHWHCAKRALVASQRGGDGARMHESNVRLHLECVAALNALFPDPDDTAERDDASLG